MTWPITPRAVTAAAEAIEDEAVRRLGFNLGTIHRDDIAQAGLLAGLNAMGAVEFGFNLEDHLRRQREFSERTFGPGARAKGVVAHIRKELDEIEADPTDLTEWIDVVILALDGAWRSGASPELIIRALINKQRRNEQRTWPDWRTASEDQPIEHDRSVAE